MTAEKLMHELNQKCGIDFNNNRRALAVEIIDAALNEFAGLNMGLSTGAAYYEPQRIRGWGEFGVADPLAAVPSVAEAIAEASPKFTEMFGNAEKFDELLKENS